MWLTALLTQVPMSPLSTYSKVVFKSKGVSVNLRAGARDYFWGVPKSSTKKLGRLLEVV